MSESWRALTSRELQQADKQLQSAFGHFAPTTTQRALIATGRRTILKRGALRMAYARFIFARRSGPLDIHFRDCAYRLWGENNLIECGLLLNPTYNGEELDFLLSDAPADANFVDIGANVGLYSLPMARHAPQGRTISIDANPLMASRLSFNANSNRFRNLTIVAVAVSDSEGHGSLKIRLDDIAIVALDDNNTGEIPIRTLSGILAEQKIDAIYGLKIDIEGHEDKALVPFLRDAPTSQLPKRIVIEHERGEDYPGCAAAFANLNYTLIGRSRNNSFYQRETN